MKTKLWVVAFAALMVVPVMGDDETQTKKKGQGKNAAAQSATAQLMKQLASVQLTDEQKTKIKEMGKKTEDEIKKVQTEAGLTAELLKKRREAAANAETAGDAKGKKRAAAVNAAVGLNEAQAAAVAKANELRAKFKSEALKLLTPEQKEKLPKSLVARPGKPGDAAGDKKPGGKKKAAPAE